MTHKPLLILTVDYEIFGNGTGCVERCVLGPAEKLYRIADQFGVPVTFFVEVLEFAAMEQHADTVVQANAVISQLQQLTRAGHDAQLHIHPQFNSASWDGKGWLVGDEWRCGDVAEGNIYKLVARGKEWLEEHLSGICSGYRCLAFRAGGWCIQPSGAVVRALLSNGFYIDSTVAPGLINYARGEWVDFRKVPDLPFWRTEGNVCEDTLSGLWELPIVTGRIRRLRHLFAIRSARNAGNGGMACGCKGDYIGAGGHVDAVLAKMGKILHLGNVMLDISTMPAGILIDITRQWLTRFTLSETSIPLVAIAHTKNFTPASAASLEAYLAWARDAGFRFGTYRDWLEGLHG